jgi:hypothetical protein
VRQVLGNQRSSCSEVGRLFVGAHGVEGGGDKGREGVCVEATQHGVGSLVKHIVDERVGGNVLDELVDLGLGLGVVDLGVVGSNDSLGEAINGSIGNDVLGLGPVQGDCKDNECGELHCGE